MRISPRNLRILGASLIAVLMVVGGYALPGFQFPKTKAVNAELTDDILAEYVSKDTDADGLPDWQEVLYGTNSNVADTDGDGISDGEAVRRGLITPTTLASQLPSDPVGEVYIPGEAPAAGSLTEQFSRFFLTSYIQASGGQAMTSEAQEELLKSLLDDFNKRATSKLLSSYTIVSVRTDANLSASEYAKSVESVLAANTITGTDTNALALIAALVEEDDEAAVPKLERLAQTYRNIADSLVEVRVPTALAQQHLTLLQAFDSLAKSTKQASSYQEDPLGVLAALAVFQPAAEQLDRGYNGIAAELLKYGEPADNAPGALIIYIARAQL